MKLLLSLTALDLIPVLVLVIGCRGDYSEFCHQLSCPQYTVVETTQDYEARQYVPTNWICTTVDGNEGSALMAARNTLRAFWDAQKDAGNEIPETWPVLIIRSQQNMCWFLPPGYTPEITDPSVSLLQLQASLIYVSSFGGTPSIASVQGESDALQQVMADVGITCTRMIGAFYDSYFSLSHHNEVWCDGN